MMVIRRMERQLGRLFGIGRMRVHPLFFALLVGAYFAHLLTEALLLFLCVILHELGHAVVAKSLGYEVEEVALLPFGGVAQLAYVRIGFSPKNEAIVAIAGPFVNLLCAVAISILFVLGVVSSHVYAYAMNINIWIAAFNLLPGLPLDGGRVYRAARSRQVGYESATEEAYNMAFGLSAILMFMGLLALFGGHPHLGMLILGAFLFMMAWRGKRDLRLEMMRFLDAKRRLDDKAVLRMHSFAVRGSIPIRDVVVRFSPERYHMIYLLDEDGVVQSLVEETELLDAVFEGRWFEPISTLR